MNTIALQCNVKRVLVEKRAGFDLEAQSLKKDLRELTYRYNRKYKSFK